MKLPIRRILLSKVLLIPVILLVLYSITGFLITPAFIRWYVPKLVKDQLKCEAALGKVRINPFLMHFEANEFKLKGPDGSELLGFERILFDFDMRSLVKWAVIFKEFRLEKPVLNLVVEADGALNLASLVPKSTEAQKNVKPPGSKPIPVLLRTLKLAGGEVTITDRRQADPAVLNFHDLELDLNSLSTLSGQNGTYCLKAKTAGGEGIEWQGDISAAPFRSSGNIVFSEIKAATLWKFLQNTLNVDSPGGSINITTDYRIDTSASPLQMALENTRLNLSQLTLKLSGTDELFLELGKLESDCALMDLASKSIHMNKLILDGGKLDLIIDKSGRTNFAKLIRTTTVQEENERTITAKPEERTEAASEVPWKLSIDEMALKDIALRLEDLSRATPISAAVSSISISSKANIETGANIGVSLNEIETELRGLQIGAKGASKPLFAAQKFLLEGGELDLGERKITVSRIALSDGRMDFGIEPDGKLNFDKYLAPRAELALHSGSKPARARDYPWKFLLKTFELDNFRSALWDHKTLPEKDLYALQDFGLRATGIDGKSPMDFQVKFRVEQGGKVVVSGKADPSSRVVQTNVDVSGLTLAPLQPYFDPFITLKLQSAAVSTRGVFRYGIPKSGSKLGYEGGFGIDKLKLSQPGSKETYLGWDSLQIPKLKLTLEPNGLQIPEIMLSKPVGEVIIAPDRTLNLAKIIKDQPTGTAPPPRSGKPKVRPAAASRMAVGGSGSKVSQEPGQQSAQPFPFAIGKVRVSEGNVLFADLSLKPKFMARIHKLKGTVGKLSSDKRYLTEIRLDGLVDKYGFAKVFGTLDINSFKRSSDLKVIFRNVEMASISPYSGKFAGRRIKSGKLSLDLDYRIQDSKLIGDNKIIVDNLVLGERVESRDAVNLPLDLAVALLSDSNGRIDLGLPVSGDLSDPQFKLMPLVWKAIGNLIKKAVTAPFRALKSLFGTNESEEGLDVVDFEPGKAVLLPPEKEKIKKVSDILQKKGQLTIIVGGRYSSEVDGLEIKELSVRREVATRMGTKLGPDEDPGSLDLDDSDTRSALEKIFSERFGSKAFNELDRAVKEGKIKPRFLQDESGQKEKKGKRPGFFSRVLRSVKIYKIIPGAKSPEQSQILAGELYMRLVEGYSLPNETLVQLGVSRAQVISAELQSANGVPLDRISTKEPEPIEGEAGTSAGLSLDVLPTRP